MFFLLRMKTSQKCLTSLSLMAAESDLVRALDFNDVVEDFAQREVRKKHLGSGKTTYTDPHVHVECFHK